MKGSEVRPGRKHARWGFDPAKEYRDWLGNEAARCRRIVEVGCFAGSTTKRMAEATRGRVWAVQAENWSMTI